MMTHCPIHRHMLQQQHLPHAHPDDHQGLDEFDIEHFWQCCLQDYPALRQVKLGEVPVEDGEIWKFSPGTFMVPRDVGDRPTVLFGAMNAEVWTHMKRTREASLRLTAQRIGIPYASLTPRLLHAFIFFHELGHAYDFLTRFAKGAHTPAVYFRAGRAWRKQSGYESSLQPIPGMSPGLLEVNIADGTLLKIFNDNPVIRERLRMRGVDSVDDPASLERLRRIVNDSYKQGRMEQNADAFAANAMRRYASHLLPAQATVAPAISVGGVREDALNILA